MQKTIKRTEYIEKIIPFIGKDIIKVLTGCRRVGKTTILLQLAETIREIDKEGHIIYINREFHEFKDIQNNEDLYEYVKKHTKKTHNNYLIIDEIQEIHSFEIALRQLKVKGYDVYCSGSNANMLSGDLATHLSGRYIEFKVHSLSYQEFLLFHQLSNNNDSLLLYIRYGGLPYLIHLPFDDTIVYDYLKSVYSTIILKDVVARYNIRDVYFLERLIEYISDTMGSYVSSKKITDFLKSQGISLSVNTVLNYLGYLSNAFFIDKVSRYDIVGKKRFEINDKYYFSDLGLKHAIIPYSVDDIGKVMENLVYKKLIEDGYTVFVGKLKEYEIDFVAKKSDSTKYIQVAYLLQNENTIDREFGNLLKIEDNYPKFVISADELIGNNHKGIIHSNIKDFLTSPST
jgi:predicted AAA+ superfamily ATPase